MSIRTARYDPDDYESDEEFTHTILYNQGYRSDREHKEFIRGIASLRDFSAMSKYIRKAVNNHYAINTTQNMALIIDTGKSDIMEFFLRRGLSKSVNERIDVAFSESKVNNYEPAEQLRRLNYRYKSYPPLVLCMRSYLGLEDLDDDDEMMNQYIAMMNLLLKYGADPNNPILHKYNNAFTPLEYLLNKFGTDNDIINYDKRAIMEFFKILMKAGATRTRLPPVELELRPEFMNYADTTLRDHYNGHKEIDFTHRTALLLFLKDENDFGSLVEIPAAREEIEHIKEMYPVESKEQEGQKIFTSSEDDDSSSSDDNVHVGFF